VHCTQLQSWRHEQRQQAQWCKCSAINSTVHYTHIFSGLLDAEHHQHLRHHPLIPLSKIQPVKPVAMHRVEDIEPAQAVSKLRNKTLLGT
jgi:hypothetical protein